MTSLVPTPARAREGPAAPPRAEQTRVSARRDPPGYGTGAAYGPQPALRPPAYSPGVRARPRGCGARRPRAAAPGLAEPRPLPGGLRATKAAARARRARRARGRGVRPARGGSRPQPSPAQLPGRRSPPARPPPANPRRRAGPHAAGTLAAPRRAASPTPSAPEPPRRPEEKGHRRGRFPGPPRRGGGKPSPDPASNSAPQTLTRRPPAPLPRPAPARLPRSALLPATPPPASFLLLLQEGRAGRRLELEPQPRSRAAAPRPPLGPRRRRASARGGGPVGAGVGACGAGPGAPRGRGAGPRLESESRHLPAPGAPRPRPLARTLVRCCLCLCSLPASAAGPTRKGRCPRPSAAGPALVPAVGRRPPRGRGPLTWRGDPGPVPAGREGRASTRARAGPGREALPHTLSSLTVECAY